VVFAASPEARAEGVRIGIRRREAEARCPGLVVIDRDPAAEARTFEAVARAMEPVTPAVVLERPGVLSFPTRGPSRYFGGDEQLAARVLEAVTDDRRTDDRMAANVGIADSAFAARLATRVGGRQHVAVIAPGATAAFLAPWPVAVLAPTFGDRLDEGVAFVDLLRRLGLRTLGDLAALPAPAVLGRFGHDGAHAHRLASGSSEHAAPPAAPPPDLVETCELDPPAQRVDEVAFAAKSLADHLIARLDELGLACDRVVVEAETEHGERHARCWRHEGGLTAAALVARVRWQLDAWLVDSNRTTGEHGPADDVTGGLTLLRLAPDRVVPATTRQLGFWGGDAAAHDRAARVLARLQGMLGHEAVATAVVGGGRAPGERIHWVPWGEPRDEAAPAPAPWPGAIPGPAPARLHLDPVPAELLDAGGEPVRVSARGEASGEPAVLRCAALPDGGGRVVAWAGPWPHDLRWWARATRRRRALWQVVVRDDVACLVAVEGGRAAVEAIYD
jgi:protein ImuB